MSKKFFGFPGITSIPLIQRTHNAFHNKFRFYVLKINIIWDLIKGAYEVRTTRTRPLIFMNIEDYRLQNKMMYAKYKNYAVAFSRHYEGIVLPINFSSPLQLILIHLILNGKHFQNFHVDGPTFHFKYLPLVGLLRSSWDIAIRKDKQLSFCSFEKTRRHQYKDSNALIHAIASNIRIKLFIETLCLQYAARPIYFVVSQTSYIDSFILNLANLNGATSFLTESLLDDRLICFTSKPSQSHLRRLNAFSIYKKHAISANRLELFRCAITDLKDRSYGNYKSLKYMKSSSLVTAPNIPQSEKQASYILLALHAFLDAPNYLLHDSSSSIFKDYFAHTLSLISELAECGLSVLIKPHPQNNRYDESHLMNAVQKHCKDLSAKHSSFRYLIIENNYTVSSVVSLYNISAAISSRGSIILELAFLNIKCFHEINSYHTMKQFHMSTCLPPTIVGRKKLFESLIDCANAKPRIPSRSRKAAILYWALVLYLRNSYKRPNCFSIYDSQALLATKVNDEAIANFFDNMTVL